MTALFHPVEQAILHDYFGLARPNELAGINTLTAPNDHPDAIHLDTDLDNNEYALSYAVARIALEAVLQRLGGMVFDRGENIDFVVPKSVTSRRSSVRLQHLITINWNNSMPGMTWPEAYYATYFPDFGRYVVTGALGEPDVHGYNKLAIGWFPGDKDLLTGAHEVLVNWWRWQFDSWDQAPWDNVWYEGAVSEDMAEEWADEIWAWGVGDFADDIATVLSPEADSGDRHSALFNITRIMTEPENIFSHRARNRADSAFAKCLYTPEISRASLIDVIDFVRLLGSRGICHVEELLKRFSAKASVADQELRVEILAALESIAPTDKSVLKTVSKRLLDRHEDPGIRWWSARVLHKITGLDEFREILQLPTVKTWREVKSRAAPWDSEIYIGREWYIPRPDRFQKQLGVRCLKAMEKELGEAPLLVAIGYGKETENAISRNIDPGRG